VKPDLFTAGEAPAFVSSERDVADPRANEFVAPSWISALRANQLICFTDFWALSGEAIDDRNVARGGWSDVTRLALKLPSGGTGCVFVKRQFNYQTRSWRCPLRGEPTLQREFRALDHCRRHGISTPEVVYFATEAVEGRPAAVLVTAALEGFEPLNTFFASMRDKDSRSAVLAAIARALARLHASGLKHGCLYPKHIFVRAAAPTGPAVCFIDLEKARPFLSRRATMERDFGTLFRRLPMCTAQDFDFFRNVYRAHGH
jgi:tRNA A-37 threonylcarbamoyl transferase component Bud32